jgi:hypothetical protein
MFVLEEIFPFLFGLFSFKLVEYLHSFNSIFKTLDSHRPSKCSEGLVLLQWLRMRTPLQ